MEFFFAQALDDALMGEESPPITVNSCINMSPLLPHLDFLRNVSRCIRNDLPYKLLLITTFSCNSRCALCNNWKRPSSDELGFDEIRKIFSHISFPISWLAITGGEPFLRDDLIDIIQIARECFPSLQLLSIVSNGILQERIEKAIKKLITIDIPFPLIRFSIDGPEDVHDTIRGVPGGYRKTLETYEGVKKILGSHSRADLGIELTISPLNIQALDEYLPWLLKNYRVNLTVAHRGYLYDNQEEPGESFTLDPLLVKKVLRHQQKTLSTFSPSGLIQKIYLESIPSFIENPRKLQSHCAALHSSFGIDPAGNLIPCLMWNRPLGNLRDVDYQLMNLWEARWNTGIMDEIRQKKCPLCWTPCEAYQKVLNDIIRKLPL